MIALEVKYRTGSSVIEVHTPAPFLEGFAPVFDKVPAPLSYRLPDGHSAQSYAESAADALEAKIRALGPETVLAFVIEPIGGLASGCVVATDDEDYRVVVYRENGFQQIAIAEMDDVRRASAPMLATIASRTPGVAKSAATIGVSTVVGETTFTRTRCAPYSDAAIFEAWLIPALAPAYGA